jgi:ribosomal protein S18 acetylase RimI-like enzyme
MGRCNGWAHRPSPDAPAAERLLCCTDLTMLDLHTRPTTRDDVPFLRSLHHEAYRDVVTRQFGVWDERQQDESFHRDLADSQFAIVEANDQPIGAIGTTETEDWIRLAELWIVPAWQNRGVGSSLVRKLQEQARESGKSISLRVLHQNRARALYERLGFAIVGDTDIVYLMEWRPNGAHGDHA